MKALRRPIRLPVALILAGAKIFQDHGCYQCHTLSIAKATGQVGPNLDLLKPDPLPTSSSGARPGRGDAASLPARLPQGAAVS